MACMGPVRRFFMYLGFLMLGIGVGFMVYGASQNPSVVPAVLVGMVLTAIGAFLAFGR